MKKLSRRKFIATATTAFSFQYLPKRVWGANDRINVAGIGVGGKGTADIASAAESGANIVALCDVDLSRGAKTISTFSNAKLYSDFRVMLEKQKGIDAVIISAPDHIHAVAAKAAMDLGKHIYCQKPLTHSIYEARVLTEAAAENKLVTQMGNQAHAGEPIRRAVELVRAGIIGNVTDVHVWTNRPIWPQGMNTRPAKENAPNDLDWNLWLGPAPQTSYSSKYVPFKWRGWWDYGTGALGDMACHIMDMPYWSLKLKYPLSVEAEQGGNTKLAGPNWSKIKYQYPARGSMPPVTMTWYDGRKAGQANMPPPDTVDGEDLRGYESVLIGDKGSMVFSRRSTKWKIVGRDADEVKQIEESTPRTIPRIEQDTISDQTANHVEWLSGIKGQGTPQSNFAHSGPFTETVLLGNLAIRTGEKIDWNGAKMKPSVNEAKKYIKRKYRKGWSL
ncbi:MAG: Gfo/Idh/MocA family oxidoreductase [Opitutae bacterium]|nr:Gfo/Idh/MocA family oxidoreductase [Opitutae bacterium]MBT5716865.1 Gfo/Idh/MocA family oxidoreductase [Opitutae bacterium]